MSAEMRQYISSAGQKKYRLIMLSFLLEYDRVPDDLEKDNFCLFYAELVTCYHPISIFKPFKIQNINKQKLK